MKQYKNILIDVLNSAESKDYKGYSKFDALNSPFLRKISFNNKWLKFLFIQLVKESPFHIRPLLKIETSRNPKGIALFARSYFFLYEKTKIPEFLKKGENLLQWLLDNPSPDNKNLCWGYNFIWQNTIFLQDEFEPNVVVTIFVGEALIHAFRLTGNPKYLKAAISIANFIIIDLPVLYENQNERAISYVKKHVEAIVLNNQVLAGAFLIKVWKHSGIESFKHFAIKHINYTVNRKTDYNAWFYTYPKEKSLINHDNYHTGGILDGILEYFEATSDARYMDTYWKGLEYYKNNLFELNGAPRWMNNKSFPYDIHGSAQGIITFKKASKYDEQYLNKAKIISDWAVDNFYRQNLKDFIYRKGIIMKWNYSLMRWCNAWMARAIGELIY
ncbi:MAG: hypothetical protein HQK76_05165 [Desulfobacterales bacterium]|nr:hypothetical protein [Desulfobacterales bacterium]